MAENHAFFVRGDDGEEYGPVDLVELREWVTENRVGLGTTVRLDAPDGAWNAWQHYPELVALLAEVQVSGAIAPSSLTVLAPFGRRVTAGVADIILSFALALPLAFVSVFSLPVDLIVRMQLFYQGLIPAQPAFPVWFIVLINGLCFFIPLLYFAGFIAAHGRTPAKSLLNLQVVDALGRKPAPAQALMRALIFMISVYFFYGIPLLYAFFNPQRRTLHDIAAGTYVVES
jgi:uncharacterized RDD family membrane protein YckC